MKSLLFKRRKIKPWRKKSKTFTSLKFRFFKKNKINSAKDFKVNLSIVFILFVIYFVFFSNFFVIKKIEIEGNRTISKENIEKIIKSENSNSVLIIFKENNFFLNNREKIKKKLLNKFSEIKAITVEKKFPDTIKVKINEKTPLIIWCRIGSCYYLDAKGVAFMVADNNIKTYKDKRFVKIIEEANIKEEANDKQKYFQNQYGKWEIKKDKDGKEYYEKKDENNKTEKIYLEKQKTVLTPIKTNDLIADKDFLDFILKLDNDIRNDTNLKIKYYKTKGVETRELIAYTNQNTRIYFNATNDIKLQITYLNDFLEGIKKNKINTLKYIYLESGNKIFYK